MLCGLAKLRHSFDVTFLGHASLGEKMTFFQREKLCHVPPTKGMPI